MSVRAARMFEILNRLEWGVIKKLNNANNQGKFIGTKYTKVKRAETLGMSNPKGKWWWRPLATLDPGEKL